jgi:phage minor structural protein
MDYAIIFDAADTQSLGRVLLSAGTIQQEINGEYSCSITAPVADGTGWDLIAEHRIVVLRDADGTDQRFRLTKPTQTLEAMSADGWHITYDLSHDLIVNRQWDKLPGSTVWPELLQAGISERRFTGASDIATVSSAHIVREGLLSTLINTDQDNSFISRWGGETKRDNYQFDMLARVGQDRHYYIALGRNLTAISIKIDDSTIVNRVLPTYLDASDVARLLPEVYIDSPLITATPVPHAQAVHYSDIKIGDKDSDGVIAYPTKADAEAAVRARIAQYWADGLDKPSITISIDFVALKDTEQYQDLTELEELQLGDSVIADVDDYTVTERLVAYTWDAVAEAYTELTLGSVAPSLDSSLAKISTRLDQTDEQVRHNYSSLVNRIYELNEAAANANGLYSTTVTNADGSKVYYYHDQPALEDSQLIEYYPAPGTRMWTSSGWNDGSPEWQSGYTNTGMLVMRLIATEGLEADWVHVDNGQSVTDIYNNMIQISEQISAQKAGGSNLILNTEFGNASAPSTQYWYSIHTWDLLRERHTWETLKASLTWQQLKDGDW